VAANEIRFVCGKYIGKTGWIDNEKEETKKMIYVIVVLENGSTKKTRVQKESVRKLHGSPSNYTEAILQQCPNIKVKMEKLCRELTKCSVAIDANDGILEIKQKGSKATYHHVSHNTGNAGNTGNTGNNGN
jgi:hypothetical protein